MLGKLFLLFTLVPIIEIYLLIHIGELLGAGVTVGLVLATGLLGAALAKREGARVLQSWRDATARGQIPEEGVLSSVLVLVGGVLLVTPGVFTDAFGLALLIPPTRRMIAGVVRRRLQNKIQSGTIQVGQVGPAGPAGFPFGASPFAGGQPGDVIDVDAKPTDPSEN